jgi:superfamily II DNA or RNA helicase
MRLRPYQKEAVDSVVASWREFDRVLGIAPTGAGKTIIFASIAAERLPHGPVLILAHREELIDQAIEKLHKAKGLCAAKEKAQERASVDASVVVASVQTLARQKRLERFSTTHFRTIIVDEAHHALAESYQRILGHFHGPKVLGVTATPDRGDTRSLGQYFEDVSFEIGLVDLIKAGYLCRIKVQTVPVSIDISGVSVRAGDFSDDELGEALEPVLDQIAETILSYASTRKTLIFVPLVRIADRFAETLRGYGFAAEMISGACFDRADKLARFRNGETQILVNAMLLTEGYDEPSVDCVICLRPTKIRSLYAQQIGRGTRTHPGKENLLLLDFLWLSRQRNLVKPADLIAHDENESLAIDSVLEEEEGDLVDALATSRERALARQILTQRKLKGEVRDLLDIVDLCVAYKAPELESYVPTMGWHSKPISEKQADCLRRYRIDLSVVHDRGHASAIIDTIVKHSAAEPASFKQLKFLQSLGYQGELATLSKPTARRLIAQLLQQNRAASFYG